MCSIAFCNYEKTKSVKQVSSKDLLYYRGCRPFGHCRTVNRHFELKI